MAVQATSAMSIVIADSNIGALRDPVSAVSTLAILTGIVMIIAGLLNGGRLLRFVPSAVMVGFVSAIGVNIVLGQLPAPHRRRRATATTGSPAASTC